MTGMLRRIISRRSALAIAVAVVIAAALAFKPVTRAVFASQTVCFGCHYDGEYDPLAKPAVSKVHEATPGGRPARCVECHVPDTMVSSVFVYTHFFPNTDLFGNWRGPRDDRPFYTPIAKKAYAVRDAMLAADSSPCRSCHIEEEIKPKRKRGQNAHKRALKKKETCLECHYNLVHREVDLR